MYGTQATLIPKSFICWFENDVKMYGTQAQILYIMKNTKFENDVKMYGTQAEQNTAYEVCGLRMM